MKYDDTLVPFLALMRKELHANSSKGDRPGWLTMSRETALLEIYYHVSKLQKAVRDDDANRIRENAADVANMAMMLLDVCGGLSVDTEPRLAEGSVEQDAKRYRWVRPLLDADETTDERTAIIATALMQGRPIEEAIDAALARTP